TPLCPFVPLSPPLVSPAPLTPGSAPPRLQDLDRDEESLGEKEQLSLIHGFLQAEVQLQLSELEAKLRREELSENPGKPWNSGLWDLG
uniref:Uncharacterized protein n=1 Tax=Ficedula albicollis TaxID=59894 RepID=A0A803WB64_FICAL